MYDLEATFARGGRELIDVLEYCAISIRMDPIFAFLESEYRMPPTPKGALALYDLFCADPLSPTRLTVSEQLPPRNLKLRQTAELLRETWVNPPPPPEDENEVQIRPRPLPAKNLFDEVAAAVRAGRQVAEVRESYNPELEPTENLPGGKMSGAQRVFIDQVWLPRVRPTLVAAGFRRIANVA